MVVPAFSRVVKTHISPALCLLEGNTLGNKSLKRSGSRVLKTPVSVGCGWKADQCEVVESKCKDLGT